MCFQIRDNLGISVDNQSSPPQPAFIPPIRMLASWLFRVKTLVTKFRKLRQIDPLSCLKLFL